MVLRNTTMLLNVGDVEINHSSEYFLNGFYCITKVMGNGALNLHATLYCIGP